MEWKPVMGEGEGGESDEGDEDEGVYEGKESVLAEREGIAEEDEMDTIARTAQHSYYLRSLHELEYFSGPSTPKITQPRARGWYSIPLRLTTFLCLILHFPVAPAPTYNLPTPSLPPPPTPKGTSAGDYYEALVVRDQEMRKGR